MPKPGIATHEIVRAQSWRRRKKSYLANDASLRATVDRAGPKLQPSPAHPADQRENPRFWNFRSPRPRNRWYNRKVLDTHIRTSRIKGSLYGLLVGDALGCPVEGWSPMRIKRQFGVLAMMEATGRPRGLHSDDGQQTVALCDAILADPQKPAPLFAQLLVDLYLDGPRERGRFGHHRGTGANFRTTVEKLAEGTDLYSASMPSAGNGNAMLIAPAAWFWSDDPDTLLTKVIDISLVKQHHICGVASAAAVAHIVAYAIENGALDSYPFPELLDYVRTCERQTFTRLRNRGLVQEPDTTFSSALSRALEQFDLPRKQVILAIEAIANETADRKVYAASGYSVASVITSLYFSLASTSLFDAIVDTVNLGGDADTTGAMVGAIVGAASGFEAIPGEWLKDLVANKCFDDRIEPMALKIAGWKPAKALVEQEAQWTAQWPVRERAPLGPLWQHAHPRTQTPPRTKIPPRWEEDDEDDDPWEEFEDAHEADQNWDDDDFDDPPTLNLDHRDTEDVDDEAITVDEDALNEALKALGGRPVGQAQLAKSPPAGKQAARSGPFPRPLPLDDPGGSKKVYHQRNRRGWPPRTPRLERHNPEEQPCPPRELGETLEAMAEAEYQDVYGKPWPRPQPPKADDADPADAVFGDTNTGPQSNLQKQATPEPDEPQQVSLFPDFD